MTLFLVILLMAFCAKVLEPVPPPEPRRLPPRPVTLEEDLPSGNEGLGL